MELRSSRRDFQEKQAQYECKKKSCEQQSLKTEDQDLSDDSSGSRFESFADSEINSRYRDYMMRSFVDLQSGFRWCPGLACNRAIKLGRFLLDGKEQREITCPCGMIFCLDCGKEGHLPATCDEKTTWDNNSAENSASEMWKVRHAAPCRKCPNVIF